MTIIPGVIWVVLIALWESAGLPVPGLLGAAADLALLVVLMWAYARNPADAIILAVVGGVTMDVLSGQPLGITVLALLPATVVGSIRGARMLDTEWLSTIVLAAVATMAYHVVLITMLQLTEGGLPIGTLLSQQLLPAIIVNALLAPVVYLIVWAASFDVRPARRALRTPE